MAPTMLGHVLTSRVALRCSFDVSQLRLSLLRIAELGAAEAKQAVRSNARPF